MSRSQSAKHTEFQRRRSVSLPFVFTLRRSGLGVQMAGRRRGETQRQVIARKAASSLAVAGRLRAATAALAVTTWLLGFEKRAIAEMESVGYGPEEAEEFLQTESLRYFPPIGPCEAAADLLGQDMPQELRQLVVSLGSEVDRLQAMSPSSYRAFISAMATEHKASSGRSKKKKPL